MVRMILRSLFLSLGTLLATAGASAQTTAIPEAQDGFLTISDAEFATWPQYCQSRYVTVPGGDRSRWAAAYPRTNIEASRKLLGQPTFERVHHYCYGLVWLERTKREGDPNFKARYLTNAHDEVMFTHRGLSNDSPLLAKSYVAFAMIDMERGKFDSAIVNAREAVKARPTEPEGYSALAIIFRKNKQLENSRDILIQGDEALGGRSADINYNLGLIYLELGDTDNALARAHIAYAQGYPLPGLRNRLRKAGKWQEPAARAQ
jgi:tetratricopeptide (TPR) repeat protein